MQIVAHAIMIPLWN